MQTRLLIIVIIILAVSITYISFAYNQEIRLSIGIDQTGTKHYFPANGDNYIIPDKLQTVLESCACHADPNLGCFIFAAEYRNATHNIDNAICEWRENEN